MKEYIEREAALKAFCEFCGVCPEEKKQPCECDDILNGVLKKLPAADVEEVRHGRWIKSESSGLYKCSKCGRYATNSDVLNWEYCNCGAKIDGGSE